MEGVNHREGAASLAKTPAVSQARAEPGRVLRRSEYRLIA